jgi:hypothetical protein
MSRFDISKRDGGRFFPPVSYRQTENREEKGFNPREVGNELSPVPRPLSGEPSRRGPDGFFDTTSWKGLARLLACTWPAWMLAPSIRREAARDPLLEWDPERRTYRRRDGGGEKVDHGPPQDRRRPRA